jgi:hypothetical protein
LAGTCQCCIDGERSAGNGCTDCELLLSSIRDEMDELVDATLRFLPFVENSTEVAGGTSEAGGVHELRRQVFSIADVSQKLETATGEFRTGCSSAHLAVLKALAVELATATEELSARLTAAVSSVTHASR